MNTKLSIAIVAAVAGLFVQNVAVAQEATTDTWISEAKATKTRAQVQAELAQARADGTVRFTSAGYMERSAPIANRDTVRAQTAAALRSGEIAALNAEVPATQPGLVNVPSTRTAQQGR
jgi:6-phosphofructokinase